MIDNYSANDLDTAILALEARQKQEAKLLKAEFRDVLDSVRPINLIKSTLQQVKESSELKGNLLNTAIGLGAGFISKKAFVGFSHNPLKRMVGAAVMFGVTNLVAKNPLIVRMAALGFLKLLKRNPGGPQKENGSLDPDSSLFYMK